MAGPEDPSLCTRCGNPSRLCNVIGGPSTGSRKVNVFQCTDCGHVDFQPPVEAPGTIPKPPDDDKIPD
jgi:hypothetical protein